MKALLAMLCDNFPEQQAEEMLRVIGRALDDWEQRKGPD
jgi:hypothetical protein